MIEFRGVSRVYKDNGETEALREVCLTVKKGEFVSLIGASGCGKTTMLRLAAGLDKPDGGEVFISGETVTKPTPRVGYVFQRYGLFPWLTVEQNIAFGLKARGEYKARRGEIGEYINLVGLSGFEKAFPHKISGGMAQRAALARALINRPEVLLLDEPMGALDAFTRADLQEKLLELCKRAQVTAVLVTHDADEAVYLSDRAVVMTPRPGKIQSVMDVTIPRPRHRGGTEFLAMRRRLLEELNLAAACPPPEYSI